MEVITVITATTVTIATTSDMVITTIITTPTDIVGVEAIRDTTKRMIAE